MAAKDSEADRVVPVEEKRTGTKRAKVKRTKQKIGEEKNKTQESIGSTGGEIMKKKNHKLTEKIAFIWKKSIYDNNFHCTRCGTLLFDKLTDDVGFDVFNPTDAYCVKCRLLVAHTQKYDGPEPGGLLGHVSNAKGRFLR